MKSAKKRKFYLKILRVTRGGNLVSPIQGTPFPWKRDWTPEFPHVWPCWRGWHVFKKRQFTPWLKLLDQETGAILVLVEVKGDVVHGEGKSVFGSIRIKKVLYRRKGPFPPSMIREPRGWGVLVNPKWKAMIKKIRTIVKESESL